MNEEKLEYLKKLNEYKNKIYSSEDSYDAYFEILNSYSVLCHIDEDLMHEFAKKVLDESDNLETLVGLVNDYFPLFEEKLQ